MDKFKKGDKIKLPIKKTAGLEEARYNDCSAIRMAKKRNQDHLYIYGKDPYKDHVYRVGVNNGKYNSSFHESDLELYDSKELNNYQIY